ncbi:BPTI/Kunitz domain-containing protein-like, partial [Saccostrea cucullata]|uniref:BPTI/Kunitz domain-containing protein-like n=1 Tax=Saccostrea cuccullata TaxID=36930 RepID=UPI002ED3FF4A
ALAQYDRGPYPPKKPVGVCILNDGRTYKVGENFPAGDGCNGCTCRSDLSVVCTLIDCGGNPSDVCSQPKVVGPCKALIRRWWYNKRTANRCERFNYGGCQGNQNNFESKKGCENRCKRRACKFELKLE